MRTRLITSALCLALTGLGATLAVPQPETQPLAKPPTEDPMRGPTQPVRGPGLPGGRRGGGELNVEASMKTMNRNVKALRSMLNDPAKKDECLRTIGETQRACIAAKSAPIPQPILGKAKDDAERAALTAKYRADLIAVMRRLLDAEEHIAADKVDLAKADLEEILKLKDQGHKDVGLDEVDR